MHSFLYCPEEPEEEEPTAEEGNGNGEKKNGNGNGNGKKNGNGNAKKNGNGNGEAKNGEMKEEEEEEEEEAEEAELPMPWMHSILVHCPQCFQKMKCRGDNFYGWIQAGYTQNFSSPNDRVNFGVNMNWRSNDYRFNQAYFVFENALEHDDEANCGYRVDLWGGHNVPFFNAYGFLDRVTGGDPTSGYGVAGPASFRNVGRIGIDLPQFYVNTHIPNVITKRGIDLAVGKFWTLMGYEVYPAPNQNFYSHSYEIIYATPFTHTGGMLTVHVADTLDVTAMVVQGADVFRDNNSHPSFMGNFVWNSCDKRWNWTTAWITGPEQFNNNQNYRTVITSNITRIFGSYDQWRFVLAGNAGWEDNAVSDAAGTPNSQDAEWYGASAYLFYTVDPRLILGARAEWWRDDDGARTAVTRRPGFSGNFYEVTLGATYKCFQNFRIRPEIRVDWFDGQAVDGSGARPYNDLLDNVQATAAIDFVWEF